MGKKDTILFKHIHKTAGSTFKFILANSFGLSYCNSMSAKPSIVSPQIMNRIKPFYPWLKAVGGHNIEFKGEFLSGDYFRVAFLREPISRTISHFQYCYRNIKEIDIALANFDKWISDPQNQNHQIKTLGLTDDFEKAITFINNNYDFIGLTDQFDLSLQILMQVCPLKINPNYNVKQKSKNVSLARVIRDSEYHMNLIKQHNLIDIELYNYIVENYFKNNYLKNYTYNKNKRFAHIKSKHTPKELLSLWYNKFVFRIYWKMFNGYPKQH